MCATLVRRWPTGVGVAAVAASRTALAARLTADAAEPHQRTEPGPEAATPAVLPA
ncbi:hypothetical protein [Blastococcus sp. SYSU DS0619]